VFAYGAERVAETSTVLSWIGTTGFDFGPLFPLFCFLILSGFSNAVNLTDGLDGLAAGTSAFVFGAYTIIAYWIFRHGVVTLDPSGAMVPGSYVGSYAFAAWLHADGVAIAAASAGGAVIGFLWWNAPPARIFMGDTGSLGIGGMLAALAVLTETELLLVIMGGLFVIITLSVIIQVFSFRVLGRRVFKMAPLQHHFELSGWQETTVIVRFWIIGGLATAFALGLFYADYLTFRPGGFG
jgi:phospho-N-acetylmuramoyl-pentapeptide-transferase